MNKYFKTLYKLIYILPFIYSNRGNLRALNIIKSQDVLFDRKMHTITFEIAMSSDKLFCSFEISIIVIILHVTLSWSINYYSTGNFTIIYNCSNNSITKSHMLLNLKYVSVMELYNIRSINFNKCFCSNQLHTLHIVCLNASS